MTHSSPTPDPQQQQSPPPNLIPIDSTPAPPPAPDPSAARKRRKTGASPDRLEQEAERLLPFLLNPLRKRGAQFARSEDGTLYLLIDGKRILLTFDSENDLLSDLLLQHCRISITARVARPIISRLRIAAAKEANRYSFRRFSALSRNGTRLYIPIQNHQLLVISAESPRIVPNGRNDDLMWVEHPENEPMTYSTDAAADPRAGLELFEELLVSTQACAIPEMKWFVGVGEALFPLIRDVASARPILLHRGGSEQGKTTGASRVLGLHALGDVEGNVSVAALNNSGEVGLRVLDNKEHSNLSPDLLDYLIFASTGGRYRRSTSDGRTRGSSQRPVLVLTNIEGTFRDEVQRRVINIDYYLPPERRGKLDSDRNEDQLQADIIAHRHRILAAFVSVVTQYFRTRNTRPTPDPIPAFRGYFRAVCDLLRAYGEVAGKDPEWVERLIAKWAEVLGSREKDESPLTDRILQVLEEHDEDPHFDRREMIWQDTPGVLYVTEVGKLLIALERLRLNGPLPKTAEGLGRRLRNDTFRRLTVLSEDSGIAELRRTKRRRPIGIFVFSDEPTQPEV